MKPLILILVISALTARISMAGDFQGNPGMVTGDILYERCLESSTAYSEGFCMGYVAGIYDGLWEIIWTYLHNMEGVKCDTIDEADNLGDFVTTVKWVFRNYPEASLPNSDAQIVVGRALWHLWRCEGPQPKEWS